MTELLALNHAILGLLSFGGGVAIGLTLAIVCGHLLLDEDG